MDQDRRCQSHIIRLPRPVFVCRKFWWKKEHFCALGRKAVLSKFKALLFPSGPNFKLSQRTSMPMLGLYSYYLGKQWCVQRKYPWKWKQDNKNTRADHHTFGLYSALRACKAIALRSNLQSKLTVDTIFLSSNKRMHKNELKFSMRTAKKTCRNSARQTSRLLALQHNINNTSQHHKHSSLANAQQLASTPPCYSRIEFLHTG